MLNIKDNKYSEIINILDNIDIILNNNYRFEEYIFDLPDYSNEVENESNKHIEEQIYIFYIFLSLLFIIKRDYYKINIPTNISNPLFIVSNKLHNNPYIEEDIIFSNSIFELLIDKQFLSQNKIINSFTSQMFNIINDIINNEKYHLLKDNFLLLKQINIYKSIIKYDYNNIYFKKQLFYENNDINIHTINLFQNNSILSLQNDLVDKIKDIEISKDNKYYLILTLNEFYNFLILNLRFTLQYFINNNIYDKNSILYQLKYISNNLNYMCELIMDVNINNFEINNIIDSYYKKINIINKQLMEINNNNNIKNILKLQNLI